MVAWLNAKTRGFATAKVFSASKIGAASKTVACIPPLASNKAVKPPTKPPPIMITSSIFSVLLMLLAPLRSLQLMA